MLLLCANGLTTPHLTACLPSPSMGMGGRAALVVTADNEYKARNRHVPRCAEELSESGFSVETVDLDESPVSRLWDYDVVEFIGGNPYYLLRALRAQNAVPVLSALARDRVLIGWSAGAVVMTPSIGIIDEFTPELNLWGVDDLTGLCLTSLHIVPHYEKFCGRFDAFAARCDRYERKIGAPLLRLNDGEGLCITAEGVCLIQRDGTVRHNIG